MQIRKKFKHRVTFIVCFVIFVLLLCSVLPNLIFSKAQFSEQFLQTFDPNTLDTTALRQQLESSDVYEISSVPYPGSDILFWELLVPDSAQYDVQLLFREGTDLVGDLDYEIQWTRFPRLALRDITDSSPFYSSAKQAKVYCLASIASSTCIIRVHTYGNTVNECVVEAEKVLSDLFRDLSQYQ